MVNKPAGVLTTCYDEVKRPTVMDLIKDVGQRLYPVGRLDWLSSGLLLCTNDGLLTYRLSHPSYGVKKNYRVHLDHFFSFRDEKKLRDGVILQEGKVVFDEVKFFSQDRKILSLALHIGWYRIIRRRFAKLGYQVKKLHR